VPGNVMFLSRSLEASGQELVAEAFLTLMIKDLERMQ
jgi:hypothetical protein